MKTKIPLLAAGALLLAQLLPVSRENPPVGEMVPAPPEVLRILERSCFACHSNQTVWPWYAYLAPVSWLVTHDVNEARGHLNFTTWERYDARKRRKKIEEVWEEVEEGEMPLWFYVLVHPEARLTADEKHRLHAWAEAAEESPEGRSHR